MTTSFAEPRTFTLHEAAQQLGCSLGTIRRKIARGELQAYADERPQGRVWRVLIPEQHLTGKMLPQAALELVPPPVASDALRGLQEALETTVRAAIHQELESVRGQLLALPAQTRPWWRRLFG